MNARLFALPCLAAFTALTAAAQPVPPMPLLALGEYLELTQTQLEGIHQVLDGGRPSLDAKREAVRLAQRSLHQVLGDPEATESQVRALSAKDAEARLAEALEAHTAFRKASGLLTAEQRLKLKKAQADLPLIEALLHRRGGHGGPGGPGGEGPRDERHGRPGPAGQDRLPPPLPEPAGKP